MTDSEDFISWSWINAVAQWVIWNIHDFIFMGSYTNDVFITVLCHNYNVNDTIIKTDGDSFWGWVKWNTKNFLWISFWPFFNEFWWSLLSLPSFETTDFHKFTSFIFPRKLSVCYFSVKFRTWTHISSSNKEKLLWFDKNVIPDTFGFSFNSVLKLEFRWIQYNIWGIFIELEERLDEVWVDKIISDDDFSQEILKAYFSVFKIFVFHFKEERLSRKIG